ncbi:L domain-containing protein [Chloropicon roscoffensis]|uniref:L domain-containing protein n=1 Tax=Chloropicon roscoffensis TaxID=1461544 RepID=A0A7S2T6Z0_9CHLO|mmetsp:Transcript_1001/g.3623  ORF Transcript_1001/g.3623 Transcript_1001/m.3623 type:complete len:167 (+) Transcript_1001:140-640(+)
MFALRLSTDLILRSPQFMNACDEYELDLRGNKVSVIENLGGTQNQFDSIDLSDNEIVKLEGFPLLPRLKTLTLNHNRISRISKNLEASIPNLETLVLTGNRINSIEDLQNLRELSKLKRLVVLDNEITKLPDYRLQIMKLLPQLRMVDFKRAAAILASEDVEMADS